MKITVFTSNQPRHLSLIHTLSTVADHVYAVQECNTVFPGKVEDFFKKSDIMQEYFSHVIEAEEEVFGQLGFLPSNVFQLAMKMHDLNKVDLNVLAPALEADIFVVFGATYIKEPLISKLTEKRTINIHMGISPQYRGSSCNFWSQYQGNAHLMGATIHMLSKGLDSGDILYTVFPKAEAVTPAVYGMKCVEAAHTLLRDRIADGSIFDVEPMKQNREEEISYTRNADFNDEVAEDYLRHKMMTPDQLFESLQQPRPSTLVRPHFVDSQGNAIPFGSDMKAA